MNTWEWGSGHCGCTASGTDIRSGRVWRGWMVGRRGGERGFRLNFAGAKTNRRLFRATASRPVTDGHESSPDRPQSGIIEKSGGYFRGGTPAKSKRKPLHHVLRTAGTAGQFIKGPCCNREGVAGASVRHQRSGKGALRGRRGGRGWCEEQPHGQTRRNTDGHGRTRTLGG